ncbi:hypothetical protein FACS1894101_1820 [Betaproteobacteria bacterium]|nr:hypothetical protein FACS1894101_1820 [Betaproteobacteria bacterium]
MVRDQMSGDRSQKGASKALVPAEPVEIPGVDKPDRFESARGKADIQWRTDELMALLRGEG